MKYNTKKSPEELQLYFYFKRRHSVSKLKKGKGSYDRKKNKQAELFI